MPFWELMLYRKVIARSRKAKRPKTDLLTQIDIPLTNKLLELYDMVAARGRVYLSWCCVKFFVNLNMFIFEIK